MLTMVTLNFFISKMLTDGEIPFKNLFTYLSIIRYITAFKIATFFAFSMIGLEFRSSFSS